MCPLTVGALILALVLIYYAKSILMLAAGVFLVFMLIGFRKENYVNLTVNPEATGIQRPLWGPLYPVSSKETREQQYRTMRGLPWCESPLGETTDGSKLCDNRNEPGRPVFPYELDKI